MSEIAYWKNYEFISHEVNRAIECFYTYIELANLASENKSILDYFNETPNFWIIQRYSLHATFFIVLARIFDEDGDTLSIHKILKATLEYPEYFSK